MAGWDWLPHNKGLFRWRQLCGLGTQLLRQCRDAQARFAIAQPGQAITIDIRQGQMRLEEKDAAPTRFHAAAEAWEKFLAPIPPRHHHNLFAMRMRVPGFTVTGDELAWGFAEKPVLLGASMSGEICLEIALRAPERLAHIVACEATDHIPGRYTGLPLHPQVNGMIFTPEWVEGLMAPQSPAECAAEVWWHDSQGGFGTFPGNIRFYSGEWDARDRVHLIDTTLCPLTLLTGEYDYSCTAEASQATAAKIPGARFQRMDGIGHFPFAENPALFAGFLAPVLAGQA